jgi:hypothetical protein
MKNLLSPPSIYFYINCNSNSAYPQNYVKFAFALAFTKFATFVKFAKYIFVILGFGKCVDFGEYSQNQLARLASNHTKWKKVFWGKMQVFKGIGKIWQVHAFSKFAHKFPYFKKYTNLRTFT